MGITFEFSEKAVVVTGASSGIGKAVATAFVRAGAKVTILSDTSDIGDVAQQLGPNVGAIQCDISDRNQVIEALKHLEQIDILINNAGIELPTPLQGEGSKGQSDFNRVLATNVSGTQNVTQALINRIPDGGRILVTASIWSRTAVPGFSAYVASKHALLGLVRTWAQELGARQIRVNAVCPGWVKTGPAMKSLGELASTSGKEVDELAQELSDAQALPGLMEPEDIAQTYLFLASDGAANITGQAINIDRGEVMS
ncbi:SDR family NAD(P)-dependent oxidoreductase [uncultured Ruegeria sp.]|uniref:SDR family NAD(P)-dependent oxidoreductase n=1 Tax=uncultured Ruegeria sp. TaxID=259304 RepID=UPI002606AC42|nr:SDR family oxidoreductase [uncultured Ruegeria sp.]